MDKKEIERRFYRMGELALLEGKVLDIAVYGGSALAIAFNARDSTKDVDAVFETDKETVRKIAKQVAEEEGDDPDWFNDAVKGYLSSQGESVLFKSYPSEESPGIRIFVPTPEYMLALKCIDIRTGKTSQDVADVKNLIQACGYQTAEDVISLVEKMYGKNRMQSKTLYAIEEIFEEIVVTPSSINTVREKLDERFQQSLSQKDKEEKTRKQEPK